ncbi:hypothetical protein WKV44_02940 [Spirochaetia bacterium 38H-sp]|uniref:DUF4181 domain-containing protein n=1 Tax=Rarispira pelagica TaxID=3141764 RepID=A0ABU9UBE2_9SPIR
MILDIAIYFFVAMELANTIILYLKPEFKYGNSMRAFCAWEDSKKEEKTKLFAKYLVNWVANCKLIFIALLIVVANTGSEQTKIYTIIVTIFSIAVYFITLHPIIRKLDRMGEIRPKGYSVTLAITIAAFIVVFSLALVLHILT